MIHGLNLPTGVAQSGFGGGLYGIEATSPVAITGGQQLCVFDTAYPSLADQHTEPLTGPIETDDWTFKPEGIVAKFDGLAVVYYELDTDELTKPFYVNFNGLIPLDTNGGSYTGQTSLPPGPGRAFYAGILPIRTGLKLAMNFTGTEGETAHVQYVNIDCARIC